VDVRGPLTAQRRRLLGLLTSLTGAQWAAPTAARCPPRRGRPPSSVYWAGDVPLWFDLAREFTERWVHYQQIREAVRPAGRDPSPDENLPLVLRTFIWGFPHQYQAPAPDGTAIALEIPGIGGWALTRTPAGWSLDEGLPPAPATRLRMDGDAAWRLLTGARYDPRQVQISGDAALGQPLLRVRGIIV